jgi:hypothetical protein
MSNLKSQRHRRRGRGPTQALALVVLASGCAEEERVCQTYGYDLYNTTDLELRIETVEPTPGFIATEVRELPVEFHTVFLCDGESADPLDLPDLQAEWIGHDTMYRIDLDADDWSALRQDPLRGYPYYRALIQVENLIESTP